MAKTNTKEDTINKSLLLNCLSVSDENIPVSDLGAWIEAKTNGEYKLIKEASDSGGQTKSVDKP